MGYNRSEIEESLANAKYDDVFATYLLLGRKSSDVSTSIGYTCVCMYMYVMYVCIYFDILFTFKQQK
jgi:hypothetical protein